MSDLVMQGLELALMGMGFVFVFLILLVFCTSILSRVVRLTEPAVPDDVPVPKPESRATDAGSGSPDTRLIAVITAAIGAHRRQRGR